MLSIHDIEPLAKVVHEDYPGYWTVIGVDKRKSLLKCVRTDIQLPKLGPKGQTRITKVFKLEKITGFYEPNKKESL